MKVQQWDYGWLADPEVFEVNRIPAHSDHSYFLSTEELKRGEEKEPGKEMSLRRSLNGTWKFSYSKNPALRQAEFYREDYDDSGFGKIQVPGHIELQGYGNCHYVNTMYPWDGREDLRPPYISKTDNPVGSYRKEFTIPEDWFGKRIYISFQGVETAFYVWCNGQFVGYGEDSFTPSEYELTSLVKPREINCLAVEVYKRSSASWIEDQDFFRFSGIFRDVYLYAVPDFHIQDVFVKAGLREDNKTGTLDLELTLSPSEAWQEALEKQAAQNQMEWGNLGAVIRAELLDADGNLVYALPEQLGPCRNSGKIAVSFLGDEGIPDIRPWSGEDPYLYTLMLTVSDRSTGEVYEVIPQKIGFRRFQMKDKVMELNGKRIIFKGINRHEFNHRRGRCVTREDMLWDIRFLKQHNINAVRTCHYPNQSLWYELCDMYGIYLIDEANLESHGSWQKMGACEPSWNVPGSLPQWKACVVDRAKSMLERDKNHPSILIWSCGNESYAGEDILAMSVYFHQRDDSRLVHYEGVFWNRDFDQISDMESRMYATPAQIEEYLNTNPSKPYISCEYMHAMGNSLGGMKQYTDLERYQQYQGGFIWDYMDQSLIKIDCDGNEIHGYGGDFNDRPTDYQFCGNGILYCDRTLSPKVQEVKFLYQDIKLLADYKSVTIRNERRFTDTSDCKFYYQILREGNLVFQAEFDAIVPAMEEKHMLLEDLGIFGQGNEPVAMESGKEYTYRLLAVLREDTIWASSGHELGFGETAKLWQNQEEAANQAGGADKNLQEAGKRQESKAEEMPLKVVNGDVNVGIWGNGFFVQFSKQEGGITSLCYGEKEWITRPPMPVYWRATTDNDRGNHFSVSSHMWIGAGMFADFQNGDIEILEEQDKVTVTYCYRLTVTPATETKVTYVVTPDGRIQVTARYQGKTGLPQLPVFGMRFRLPGRMKTFSWYGYGPKECYPDRMEGARLGIYHSTPEENISPYLVPQECGNRTGCRWCWAEDQEGHKLVFEAGETGSAPVKKSFHSSVLPYTAEELELARHWDELPSPQYTNVCLYSAMRGVGGDDSWGAPVYPEYCISGEMDQELVFTISKTEPKNL